MQFYFTGDTSDVMEGARALSKRLGFEPAPGGITVRLRQREGNLEISAKDGGISIGFQEKTHFFRALGLITEKLAAGENTFEITETPRFKSNGVMADCSRNAVLKTGSIKDIIELMAVMGLNMLMLYTEDTYEVKAYPYFGYMRGRYTYEELKECDDHADMLGVEIVPCIQTLGHLASALKWDSMYSIRDTEDILLAGADETYAFIEEMIKSASAPFRSKRIHIGMDEAHFIGLGRYLSINGYKNRFEIMNGHLLKVLEITDKYGLEPMMWSDMYFRLGSPTGDYYDGSAEISRDIIDKIPKNLQMVYWDYYHTDSADYRRLIRAHKDFGLGVVFAGGVWVWNGVAVNYPQTFASTDASLPVCKEEGVKEVFATMWGDNGAETNFFSALPGMQLFAEHGYADAVDGKRLKERFRACTGQDMDAYLLLSGLDPREDGGYGTANQSKCLLWQDVLIGLFDRHLGKLDYPGHYSALAPKLKDAAQSAGSYGFIFDAAAALADVLALKADIGIRLKAAYDESIANGEAGSSAALKKFVWEELPRLRALIEILRQSHMKQWFATNKPFGWEVIDMRYGGLLARADTAVFRLNQYISGEVDDIPELAEERLPFDTGESSSPENFPRCNLYHRIASASVMTGV